MFSKEEGKPRRCIPRSRTCCSKKAKCEKTFMHNTLKEANNNRTKQSNLLHTYCARSSSSSFLHENMCIQKMQRHFTSNRTRKSIAYVKFSFPLRTKNKQRISTTTINDANILIVPFRIAQSHLTMANKRHRMRGIHTEHFSFF